jgi:hypothetical protein
VRAHGLKFWSDTGSGDVQNATHDARLANDLVSPETSLATGSQRTGQSGSPASPVGRHGRQDVPGGNSERKDRRGARVDSLTLCGKIRFPLVDATRGSHVRRQSGTVDTSSVANAEHRRVHRGRTCARDTRSRRRPSGRQGRSARSPRARRANRKRPRAAAIRQLRGTGDGRRSVHELRYWSRAEAGR